MNYLLTEKQKYLLKFNDRHVIDSESDYITLESADSLFSVASEDELRDKSIRQKVMVRLLDDRDTRNDYCGLKMAQKDLIFGVGKVKQNTLSSNDDDSEEQKSEKQTNTPKKSNPNLLKSMSEEISGQSLGRNSEKERI